MAKYKNGINGPVSGKVGTVVGASWRGIDYVRNVSDTSKVKWSVAQVNQRVLFALVMNWIRPLLSIINVGYQLVKDGKTPMNAAMSYHLNEAVRGEASAYEIVLSKAVFSRGELIGAIIRKLHSMESDLCYISWDSAGASFFCNADDQVVFVLFDAMKSRFVSYVNAARRADGEVMLQLPAGFSSDELHCYMHLVRADGAMVSTTVYAGLILPEL